MNASSALPPLITCLTPLLLPFSQSKEAIVVVIDILRATTSICASLHNGAISVTPLETIIEALFFKRQGYLLAGERNGSKVEGFDFGNSPAEFIPERVKGKKIAMATTNGTRAICQITKAHRVIIGAFANFSVLSNYLKTQNRPVYLLCAGWKNQIGLEDVFFAGALCDSLATHFRLAEDATHIAHQMYLNGQGKKDLLLHKASHFKRLCDLQKQNDIALCLTPDIFPVLPYLNENQEIVPLTF